MGFIDAHRKDLGIEPICRELAIAPSSYHTHAARLTDASKRSARARRDEELRVQIERVHTASFGLYGSRKIWHQMRREGIKVAKCTVERLMRTMGLAGIRRGKKTITTVSNPKAPCPLDKVNRAFKVARPNALWVVDFTFVRTDEGWLYLAVVIDLFSRQIVGFAMHERMTRQLVIDALRMAWFRRGPASGLIFHSDRGSQYASGDYQKQLKAFGMLGSMSRKGDCWDNAVTETLFGSLKVERLHGLRFGTRRAAKDEVMDWLQFYNHRRLHSTLGYLSPMNFEKAQANERKGLGEDQRKAA